MAPVFEKRKSFYCKLTCEERGGQAQVCLPHPGIRVSFRGEGSRLVGEARAGRWYLIIWGKMGQGFSSSTHLPGRQTPRFRKGSSV